MADLTIAASITRTELSLADLSLEQPGIYRLVTAGPGHVAWRRQAAQSPYVHGETLTAAVKDVTHAALSIRVIGTTAANLDSRTAALLRAFEQFSYQLTLTIDGVTSTWQCEPADYAPGDNGNFDPNFLRSFQQVYTFDVPRHPVPIAGTQ